MTQITKLRLPFALLAACAALVALPAAASAVEVVPNEIVVQYVDPATGQAPSAATADPVVIKVDNVNRALATLRSRDDVAYAVPNLIARTAAPGYTPNDPLLASLQWNFVGAYGVRAQQAWANVIAAGGVETALIMIAVQLVVRGAESLWVAPITYGKTVFLHPIAILASVTVGAALMGVLGAVIAVPVVAFLWVAFKELRSEWAQQGEAPAA